MMIVPALNCDIMYFHEAFSRPCRPGEGFQRCRQNAIGEALQCNGCERHCVPEAGGDQPTKHHQYGKRTLAMVTLQLIGDDAAKSR
jgi:hypothetical protein